MTRSIKPTMLSAAQIRRWIPKRVEDAHSHKGSNGHLLILAGSRGMSGAAVLTAMGALRAGAGLVTVASPESARAIVAAQIPEVLTLGLPEGRDGILSEGSFEELERYQSEHPLTVVAIGPGLGVRPVVTDTVRRLVKSWKMPMVLDADGLNSIKPVDMRHTGPLVITPHPGELARLLEVDTTMVQKDRVSIARQTALDLGLICLLKGYHTVVTDGEVTHLNPTGNPAMATGGMGDVLTGIIGGLLAQGLSLFDAACAGAYVHGLAADLARITDRGLLAHEVADAVPLALRKVHGKA